VVVRAKPDPRVVVDGPVHVHTRKIGFVADDSDLAPRRGPLRRPCWAFSQSGQSVTDDRFCRTRRSRRSSLHNRRNAHEQQVSRAPQSPEARRSPRSARRYLVRRGGVELAVVPASLSDHDELAGRPSSGSRPEHQWGWGGGGGERGGGGGGYLLEIDRNGLVVTARSVASRRHAPRCAQGATTFPLEAGLSSPLGFVLAIVGPCSVLPFDRQRLPVGVA